MWIAVDNIFYNLDMIEKIYMEAIEENKYKIMIKIGGDYEQLGTSVYTKEQVDARMFKLREFFGLKGE